jgi:hypothetical protein
MAEKEIRQEIGALKEEIENIRNELAGRIGISAETFKTGLKIFGIGIVSLIGLKVFKSPLGFLWKHKVAIGVISGAGIGICMSKKGGCKCSCSQEESSVSE